jgi:NADPH:quinone reductase-like Zn-dependent oxidoreductase
VLELTGGRGADVVYDCVIGGVIEALTASIRIRGQYIVYGLLELQDGAFPWWNAFKRSFYFHVYKVFDFTGNPPLSLPGDDLAVSRGREFLAAGIADGSLPPVPIDRVFNGLKSLPDALHHMTDNAATGKIVVLVDEQETRP